MGTVYVSTNGGVSFSPAATKLPAGGSTPHSVPGIAGDIWLPTGSGLYHSTAAGSGFIKLTSVQAAYQIGFGKAAPGNTYPAIYLWGQIAGVTGMFRSDNTGVTWTRINDDNHQFGWINQLVGDPNIYGRVYLATGGRGVIIAALTPLVGDANLDGQIDLNDLNTVLNNLGQPDTAWTDGNFDGAPTIDLTDLNDVLNNLGQSITATSTAPASESVSTPTTATKHAKKIPPTRIQLGSSPFLRFPVKLPRRH